MLGMLLMLMKKLDVYRDNQNKGLWRDEGNVESIENAKVLVVGLGDIGGEFALRCKKLGAYCIGIRRSKAAKPDFVNELHTLEALDNLLSDADVVALALPNSAESRGLMNEERAAQNEARCDTAQCRKGQCRGYRCPCPRFEQRPN